MKPLSAFNCIPIRRLDSVARSGDLFRKDEAERLTTAVTPAVARILDSRKTTKGGAECLIMHQSTVERRCAWPNCEFLCGGCILMNAIMAMSL